ncbi:hypothetical protein D3C79_869930 [compost metagenome]
MGFVQRMVTGWPLLIAVGYSMPPSRNWPAGHSSSRMVVATSSKDADGASTQMATMPRVMLSGTRKVASNPSSAKRSATRECNTAGRFICSFSLAMEPSTSSSASRVISPFSTCSWMAA